jgi:AhpD family alkylhydroperoxidase
MIRWLLTWMLNEGRKSIGDVEMDFAYRLRDVAPGRLFRFSFIKVVEGPRQYTPPSVYHAAGLAAAMVEDCGPCVQIHVNLGLKDGVAPEELRQLVQRRLDHVDADAALGFRFGDAVARGEDASALRDAIAAQWGEKGLIELAFVVATARFYPAVKRGMGYAHACEKVKVGDQETYTAKAA